MPLSGKLELTLQNVSDENLAIVDLPDACSFSLEPVSQIDEIIPLANDLCQGLSVSDHRIIVLLPEAKKSWELDFSNSRWIVIHKDKTVETGSLPWRNRFRLVYRPPSRAEANHLSKKEL